MVGSAKVALTVELIGVVVYAELLRTSPGHPELLDVGRSQEGQGVHGEEDEESFQKEGTKWNKQNKLHLQYFSDGLLNILC